VRVRARPTIRCPIGFCLVAAAALALLGATAADPADDSLRIYAVNIIQDPPQSWTGYGIYLGKGLVITAAHVVGRASHTKPSVRIAGMDLPASAINEVERAWSNSWRFRTNFKALVDYVL
jgi:hypothetical protein